MKKESALFKELKKSMSNNLESEFIPPRLVDYNGDIRKKWHVVVWIWDTDLDELVRKRPKGDINRFKTSAERYKEAHKLMSVLHDALKKGATTGSSGEITEDIDLIRIKKFTVIEAIEYVKKLKENAIKKTSLKDYSRLVYNMNFFLEHRGQEKLKFVQITVPWIKAFLQYIKDERKLGNKSHNNIHGTISTVVNFIKDKCPNIFLKEIDPNKSIKKLDWKSSKHCAYSMDQLKMFKEEILLREDFQLLLFIQFIFFTLARTNEIRLMKIGHILESKIFIPAENSKNGKGDYVNIPPEFEKIINEHNLRSYRKDYYIFTKDRVPGEKPVGHCYFYLRYSKILKHFGLDNCGIDYDVYSYKHTGAINMYNSGVPLEKIKEQCRHATIEQTMDYLRELDVFRTQDAYLNVKAF